MAFPLDRPNLDRDRLSRQKLRRHKKQTTQGCQLGIAAWLNLIFKVKASSPDRSNILLDLIERFALNSFQVVCEIVRDLTALSWNRPMGETDATLLKKVQDNLWREWAAATG